MSDLIEKATGMKPTWQKASCMDFEVWVDDKLVISKKDLRRMPLMQEVVDAVVKEIGRP